MFNAAYKKCQNNVKVEYFIRKSLLKRFRLLLTIGQINSIGCICHKVKIQACIKTLKMLFKFANFIFRITINLW